MRSWVEALCKRIKAYPALVLLLRRVLEEAGIGLSCCYWIMVGAYLLSRPIEDASVWPFARRSEHRHFMLAIGMLHYFLVGFDPRRDAVVLELDMQTDANMQTRDLDMEGRKIRITARSEVALPRSGSDELLIVYILGQGPEQKLSNLARCDAPKWLRVQEVLRQALEQIASGEQFLPGPKRKGHAASGASSSSATPAITGAPDVAAPGVYRSLAQASRASVEQDVLEGHGGPGAEVVYRSLAASLDGEDDACSKRCRRQ